MELILMLVALGLGGLAAWQIFTWVYGKRLKNTQIATKQEATILLEKIEKVFKVVLAEGHFTEIYDHSSKKEFLGFLQTNKKALVVAKSKVMVGYDFTKMKLHRDEKNKVLRIDAFPEAEVLSIDTDYKFYDIDQGWLNKFSSEDYTSILAEAKKTMQDKALSSNLPMVASKQIGLMLETLTGSMGWTLENKNAYEQKLLGFSDFEEVKKP
jgi:hypothetical protein